MNRTLDTCRSGANDTSTNKYSNFYLSNSDKYSNFLTLDNLSVNNNYDFLTYVRVSNDPTTYLAVSGSAANPSADVTFSDTLSNNSYFLLEFDFVHDTCYISNSYNVKRYLGYDYLNSKFVFLSGKDDDISLFSFLYDKSSNEIVFYKKIYDKVNYLNYDHSNDTLTFENALSTISTSPINNTSVFTIRNNYYILKETLSSSNYV